MWQDKESTGKNQYLSIYQQKTYRGGHRGYTPIHSSLKENKESNKKPSLYTSKERDRKTLENGKTPYAYRLVELTL